MDERKLLASNQEALRSPKKRTFKRSEATKKKGSTAMFKISNKTNLPALPRKGKKNQNKRKSEPPKNSKIWAKATKTGSKLASRLKKSHDLSKKAQNGESIKKVKRIPKGHGMGKPRRERERDEKSRNIKRGKNYRVIDRYDRWSAPPKKGGYGQPGHLLHLHPENDSRLVDWYQEDIYPLQRHFGRSKGSRGLGSERGGGMLVIDHLRIEGEGDESLEYLNKNSRTTKNIRDRKEKQFLVRDHIDVFYDGVGTYRQKENKGSSSHAIGEARRGIREALKRGLQEDLKEMGLNPTEFSREQMRSFKTRNDTSKSNLRLQRDSYKKKTSSKKIKGSSAYFNKRNKVKRNKTELLSRKQPEGSKASQEKFKATPEKMSKSKSKSKERDREGSRFEPSKTSGRISEGKPHKRVPKKSPKSRTPTKSNKEFDVENYDSDQDMTAEEVEVVAKTEKEPKERPLGGSNKKSSGTKKSSKKSKKVTGRGRDGANKRKGNREKGGAGEKAQGPKFSFKNKKTFRKKKKKNRKARMGELRPINLEEERKKFYESLKPYSHFLTSQNYPETSPDYMEPPQRIMNCKGSPEVLYATYNPQFCYTFDPDSDSSKVPFSEKSNDQYLEIAKKILNATLNYYGAKEFGREMNYKAYNNSSVYERNFMFGADKHYFNSFGPTVDQKETERTFKKYIEELGLKFISQEEKRRQDELERDRILASEGDPFLNSLAELGDYDLNQLKLNTTKVESKARCQLAEKRSAYLRYFEGNEPSAHTSGVAPSITLEFSTNTIAPTKVVHTTQSLSSRMVVALPVVYRQTRLLNVLNHEIGTHYVRKFNDFFQDWYRNRTKHNMKSFKSYECLCTEEGLASINQTFEQAIGCADLSWNQSKCSVSAKQGHKRDPRPRPPFLFQAALHYYASYLSSQLSFRDLYNTLKRYISDEVRLWRECVRVKRGVRDTGRKAGFYKDQVYLIGAVEVLRARDRIDFFKLYKGKICLEDYFRIFGDNETASAELNPGHARIVVGRFKEEDGFQDNALKHENLGEDVFGEGKGPGSGLNGVDMVPETSGNGSSLDSRKTMIPYFLRDITTYRKALDVVAEFNMVD